MTKLLLVEDDMALAELLLDGFEKEGWTVEFFSSGKDAEQVLSYSKFDLLVLDVGLPDHNGLDICFSHRKNGGRTPIVFLTGKDKPEEVRQGLDIGADDYVTKPFDLDVLLARVRANLRRGSDFCDEVIEVGDLCLNTRYREVKKGDLVVDLRRMEFELLHLLMKNSNRPMSWKQIVDAVWKSDAAPTAVTVRTQIMRLRSKLRDASSLCQVENIFGSGYRLNVPLELD